MGRNKVRKRTLQKPRKASEAGHVVKKEVSATRAMPKLAERSLFSGFT